MDITLDLCAGPKNTYMVKVKDIQKNIDAQVRAVEKANISDMQILMDTKSILELIKEKLEGKRLKSCPQVQADRE